MENGNFTCDDLVFWLQRESRRKNTVLLFMGACLGAAAVLLIVPNDGERPRQWVSAVLHEGYQRGKQTARHGWRRVREEYPDLRTQASERLSRTRT